MKSETNRACLLKNRRLVKNKKFTEVHLSLTANSKVKRPIFLSKLAMNLWVCLSYQANRTLLMEVAKYWSMVSNSLSKANPSVCTKNWAAILTGWKVGERLSSKRRFIAWIVKLSLSASPARSPSFNLTRLIATLKAHRGTISSQKLGRVKQSRENRSLFAVPSKIKRIRTAAWAPKLQMPKIMLTKAPQFTSKMRKILKLPLVARVKVMVWTWSFQPLKIARSLLRALCAWVRTGAMNLIQAKN